MTRAARRILTIPDCPRSPDRRPVVVHRLQFSPDGSTIAAWVGPARVGPTNRPGTYEVCWLDVGIGHVTRRTGLHNDTGFDPYPHWDPAVSPDLRLATLLGIEGLHLTFDDGSDRPFWDRSIKIPYEEVAGFCFHPDGRHLLAVGFQGLPPPYSDSPACQIIRCKPYQELATEHPPFVPYQVPNPFIPGQLTTITRRPLRDPWEVIADLPRKATTVSAQAVSPDGNTAVIGSTTGELWTAGLVSDQRASMSKQPRHTQSRSAVHRLAFSPKGDRVVSLHPDCVCSHSLSRGGSQWRTSAPIEQPQDFAFARGGETILITDLMGSIAETDTDSGHLRRTHEPTKGPLYGIAVAPIGKLAAVGLEAGRIVLWEPPE